MRTPPPACNAFKGTTAPSASVLSYLESNTLHIEDEDLAALQEQADLEGRSVEQVASAAIREYISRHRHQAQVTETGRRVVARDVGLLRRLAE